jgi:Guanylylate cyclase
MLVDKCKLRNAEGTACPCCCGFLPVGYLGHYIVISRYEEDSECFSVLDPAHIQGRRCIDVHSLDRARRSFGTDEDVLLVSREQQPATMMPQSRPLHACPASSMHNCPPMPRLLA